MIQNAMECPETRISLGVYVLGAIDPAERAQVDAHLTTCQECRDELAGLAGLPALLARVSREEALALADTGDGGTGDGPPPGARQGRPEPPRELLATVLDLTAARRRRRRWRDASLAVAAAAIVAAGVFGGLQLGSGPAQPTVTAGAPQNLPAGPQNGPMATVTGSSGSMTATVGYTSMGWGTQLDAKVRGIPTDTTCELWVIDSGGNRHLAGTWVTDANEGQVWYPGSIGLPSGNIKGFRVTVGQGKAIQIAA